jgi:hypothetical protein
MGSNGHRLGPAGHTYTTHPPDDGLRQATLPDIIATQAADLPLPPG